LIDGFLTKLPVDGEACVLVADHLSGLGEDSRARAWLEHASHLSPPPPKSLENLGILCANNGDVIGARNLWLNGLDLDGHPDFLAHLARLSFSEGKLDDAWDQVLRALRRIYERCVRAEEWLDDGHELGLVLRYLVDHLQDHDAPEEVIEALLDLRGLLSIPEDHVDLGKCLAQLGFLDEASEEIHGALGSDLDPSYRDDGIRLLLTLKIPDFDRRFAAASDEMAVAADPGPALQEMEQFLATQPEFWPALFLKAMGKKRLGEEELALDCLADLLRICPGQPDALYEMAELFDARGNPKRALECVEDAIDNRPDDAQLFAAMARYLSGLGRADEARAAILNALELAPEDRAIKAEADRLR
jgi:tetratricopeptide (TPR) repeat protein